MGIVLIYIGALLPLAWGFAHLIPTKSVVRGFGEIDEDNRNIIAMEWIVEGVALIFVGLINILVATINATNILSKIVYGTSSGFLIVMTIVSLFTGFKVKLTPFKMCPFIFTLSAVLISSGSLMI